jgi:AcrR family transcriptional regulator
VDAGHRAESSIGTRERLLDAAAAALATDGVAAVSARTVAARAEVNQALVFYHFGTVSGLLDAAVRRSVDLAVASYRDRFADVDSLDRLLEVGRSLHVQQKRAGNVGQMAQVMAGALRDEALAGAGRYAMDRWSGEIEKVLARILPATPLAGLVEPAGLARTIAAGFIGLELYDGVDPSGAEAALASLETIGALMAAIDTLPSVAARAFRRRVRKSISTTTPRGDAR